MNEYQERIRSETIGVERYSFPYMIKRFSYLYKPYLFTDERDKFYNEFFKNSNNYITNEILEYEEVHLLRKNIQKKPIKENVMEIISFINLSRFDSLFIKNIIFKNNYINQCEYALIELFFKLSEKVDLINSDDDINIDDISISSNIFTVIDLFKICGIDDNYDYFEPYDDSTECLFFKKPLKPGDRLYIFGGLDNDNKYFNYCIRWNIPYNVITLSKEISLNLYGGNCIVEEIKGRNVYLFGGYEKNESDINVLSNKIIKYDLVDETLENIETNLMCKRVNVGLCKENDNYFIYGGYNEHEDVCCEIEEISFPNDSTKIEIKIIGKASFRKFDKVGNGIKCEDFIYTIGKRFNENYLVQINFNVDDSKWKIFKLPNLFFDSKLIPHKNLIICTGGTNIYGEIQKTAFMVNVDNGNIITLPEMNCKRREHGIFIFNDYLYVFGGSTEENMSWERIFIKSPDQWKICYFEGLKNIRNFCFTTLIKS
ncbi:Galactose oxidase/kelch, beta-propeller domain and Kelch-type beta propeller domain-containing protein [Strongyloides ratti]|uniref:Galactose oxidase/kelch, beta-propeller domain and Kelch-type beta propeller domain-containing protein n=1 Tax=Strongyloides ratti TaxID=34506 RepID=A0A090LRL5_STRRB|nr:Galactose oxidase/kelch, beta-propeller domain and Kelch-type beta propeller domain-containing protein [Strongyloides ratti]CEF70196.2 Galactose oxidase/kelch, beta-propeller domain and Kelch-type beta propeller domain-containing protein [Strongyloides ratti]